MKILKAASMACGLALMGMALSTTASADEWNKKTTITFSGPVEIPGVHLKGWAVLPAGTYVFKLLDSSSDRHIVQIFNKDENVVYATILAIPNYRLRATDKTVMTFRERPAGEPEALRAWFYPGANWGEEFVYPKAKAMEIAVATKTPVLFTETDTVEVTEPIRTVDHSVVVAMKAAPVMAVQPSGNQVAMMEVVTPLPQPTMVVQPAATLPTTAGVVPFFALFGFVALVGAIGAGVAVRRLS
jgi:hypothetical protein